MTVIGSLCDMGAYAVSLKSDPRRLHTQLAPSAVPVVLAVCDSESVDEVLREAMEPVLRDLSGAGLVPPRLDGVDWTGDPDYPSVMMWDPDGGGTGISVHRSAPPFERVASTADQVQDWAIETHLWVGGRTNWPPCPHHPRSHPLRAGTSGVTAVWMCPIDGVVVALIGRL